MTINKAIVTCNTQHLDGIAKLFDDYRVFYDQESNIALCLEFIGDNLRNSKSKIYGIVDAKGNLIAFAQLYPATCSIAMKHFYWLYDLYVDVAHRGQGHAKALLEFIDETAKSEGAQRISLDTAKDNVIAQSLYEALGYEKEDTFLTYHKFFSQDH